MLKNKLSLFGFGLITSLWVSPAVRAESRVLEFSTIVPQQASIETPTDIPGFSPNNPAPAEIDNGGGDIDLTKIVSSPVFFTINTNAPSTLVISDPVPVTGTTEPLGTVRNSLLQYNGISSNSNTVNLPTGANQIGISIVVDSPTVFPAETYIYQTTVTVTFN